MVAGFPVLDRETDRFCNALLLEISALDRRLSKALTRRLEKVPRYAGQSLPRKLAKVAIVYEEYYPLYERAASYLRALPEWRSFPPDHRVSAIYRNVYRLISDVRYPGSVESKYEKYQKMEHQTFLWK